jgi:hypothetical protein
MFDTILTWGPILSSKVKAMMKRFGPLNSCHLLSTTCNEILSWVIEI